MPEQLPNQMLTEYSVTRTMLHFPGVIQVPAGGPAGAECLFARIHAPYEKELVQWTAKCEGGPPVVPSPVDPKSPLGYNANRILLEFKFSMPIVMPMGAGGGGGHVWVVSGYALYGKSIAEGPLCNYKAGTLPFDQTSQPASYPNYFPVTNFSMTIVDPTLPVPEVPPLIMATTPPPPPPP